MLKITKENNSIKVVGQNNPTYPYSGTLVYPLNSVTVVTDQSDMAVFRSALNNDVLFTGLIDDITIAGSPVTKEDIGTKFGAISNSSSSGGGTGGGAVDSVNGQTGTVVLTASDVNAYTKGEVDDKLREYTPLEAYATEIASIKTNMGNKADKSSLDNYLLKTDAEAAYQPKGEYLTSIPEEYVTDTELEGKGYALNTSLEAEVTERQKQDSALGGMIAGETQAREQAINNLTATVQGKLDTATYNSEKATFETTAHAQETYQPKGDYASETLVNNLEGMVTDLQDYYGRLNDETHRLDDVKQDKLVSGTNIKTINSQSLLGEGNIEITVQGGGITDAPNDGKLYGRKSEQWTEVVIPDTSNLATKAELGAKLDTTTYNEEKATFALKTEIPDTSTLATKTELTEGLAGKANTSDLSDYLTKTDAQSTYATKSELGAKLDVETYNSEKATFALKSELPDTSDFITKATAAETYQPKGNYLTSIPDNYVTDEELNGKGYATTAQLNAKQDTLVSGTNIKTVNGNSLLGSGDITIESGGSGIATWDYAQIQSDQEYRTNFLSHVKVSDDLTNLGGSDNPEHASILTIDGNVYTVMYNVGGNPKVASINVQESVATITNIDAIPKNVATTSENGLMSSADKTKLDSIDIETIATKEELTDYALKSEVPKQYVKYFTGTDSGFSIVQTGTSDTIGGLTFGEGFTVVNSRNTPSVSIDTETIATKEDLAGKQDTLVSGTNIKTVNGNSLLGSGDITIEGGTGTSYTAGEGINISDANEISVDKEGLNIPSPQTTNSGSTDNYIYSINETGKRVVVGNIGFKMGNENNHALLFKYGYWGSNSLLSTNIPRAGAAGFQTDGVMAYEDKIKLDTLQTEWFGTQSQFDGLDSKDENTLYFITEE